MDKNIKLEGDLFEQVKSLVLKGRELQDEARRVSSDIADVINAAYDAEDIPWRLNCLLLDDLDILVVEMPNGHPVQNAIEAILGANGPNKKTIQ